MLGSYGTGAVMAVPAHDERDLVFAREFDLGVRRVVAPVGVKSPVEGVQEKEDNGEIIEAFTGRGLSINSGEVSG